MYINPFTEQQITNAARNLNTFANSGPQLARAGFLPAQANELMNFASEVLLLAVGCQNLVNDLRKLSTTVPTESGIRTDMA